MAPKPERPDHGQVPMDRYGNAALHSSSPGSSDEPPVRRRMGITNRLRWSYLVSSIVPLLLVGTLLIVVLFRVQQRNAFASQQAVADQIAGNLTTFLNDLQQQLLRSSGDLQPTGSDAALSDAVRRLVNSSLDLRVITVVNAEGIVVATATSELMAAQNTSPAPIDDRLIKDAIVGQGGRTTIFRGSDDLPIFQVVLPVRERGTGRIAGVLVAEVNAARISQILRLAAQEKGKTAYIIDAGWNVLITDNTSGWTPPPDLAPLFRNGETAGEYPGGDGQVVLGARTPVAPINASSWSVVVEQPSSAFFVEVYRSLFLLTAIIALVGMMTLTWALYQARRIVNPIRDLTTGAQELASGRLEHRIEVVPGDELGQLASTFNDMAQRLQGSLREIELQNERLRHGLILARDIQQGLLPNTPPWRPEILHVFGRSLPASEVGGDFYTYLVVPDGRAAIAIGDISGKGVAAALLMALTSSTLESQAYVLEHPATMLHSLHEALRPRLQANQMNAALLIAVFAADARSVTVANAGMIAPLLARNTPDGSGSCNFLDVGGLPIGTALTARYRELTVPLRPGDMLLFLSDGIVEAHNNAGELFGFERLEALVANLPGDLAVDELVQRILGEVLAFVGDAEPHDDITIIATRPIIRAEVDLERVTADHYSEKAAVGR